MLCGAILRSPLPHAGIVSIDTSKALKLPGVKAIVTEDTFTTQSAIHCYLEPRAALAKWDQSGKLTVYTFDPNSLLRPAALGAYPGDES